MFVASQPPWQGYAPQVSQLGHSPAAAIRRTAVAAARPPASSLSRSARNTSVELLGLLDCDRFLVSTDGSKHHHPDVEALARVLHGRRQPAALVFNYRSTESCRWDDAELCEELGYLTSYPVDGTGIRIEL